MGSSIHGSQLYCPIRRERVPNLPEEGVRQRFISYLILELGFAASAIAVEKKLGQLPHLEGVKVPNRRADIIVFAQNIHPEHPYFPLLLVECKAVPITNKTVQQVVGYNHFVKAPFIALVNNDTLRVGQRDPKTGEYTFSDGLPTYDQLLEQAAEP